MQKYRRVALDDRVQIQALILQGWSQKEIAKELGFHKCTISRELERHLGSKQAYEPIVAHAQSIEKNKKCRRSIRLQGKLLIFVKKRLEEGWSPEQISGRLSCEKSVFKISYQSIYRYLKQHPEHGKEHLRYGHKRRGFGRLIKQNHSRKSTWKTPISKRSKEANERLKLGHWERDTFFGAHKKGNVLVLTDRRSRYLLMRKSTTLRSEKMASMTNDILKKASAPVKTITNDNGSEFFDINAIKVPVYFCDVLKPQQRGTVENTIGLIRQYIKRGTALDEVSHRKIRSLQNKLNMRPRKTLDYLTPYEIFHSKKVALAM